MKKTIVILISLFITFILIFLSIFAIYYIKWNGNKEEIYYKIKSLNNKIKNKNLQFFQPFSIKIYDRNNKLITQIYNKRQSYVELDKFPPFIIDLVLLKEDRDFFNHKGINFIRLLKALIIDLRYMKPVYGGSTITQQVSKLLFLNLHKTIKRKIFEIFTAFYIEKILSKEEILEIYLNIVNLGFGRYGFDSASQFYFGKNVWDLNFEEGIMLVSIISAPEKYSPLKNIEKAKIKYKTLLNLAVKACLIDINKSKEIYNDFFNKYNFLSVLNKEYIYNVNKSSWISSLVINYIKKNYSLNKAFIGNYKIYTTFDLNAQQNSLNKISSYFKSLYTNLGDKYEKDLNNLEIAFIAINPNNGEIVSIIGGRRYSPLNEFNRAIFSKRQIGSTIKPFLYSYAIKEKVITPLTIINDAPITLDFDGKKWSPKNYGNKYFGPVPVYMALQKSLNTVSVRISQMVDLQGFIDYFSNFFAEKNKEIKNRLKPFPSLALGSFEFSPIELAQGYSVFPNGGFAIEPFYIKKILSGNDIIYIKDKTQNNILKNKDLDANENNKNAVISNDLAKEISYLLSFPLKKGGTAYWAKTYNNYDFPIYGKTGTTNNYKDSWFVGFTKNLVTVCWIGYEKGSGNLKLTGGGYSANLDLKILKYLYPLFPGDIDFSGKNIKFANICSVTYKLANKTCPQVTLLLDIHDIPYEHCSLHKDSKVQPQTPFNKEKEQINLP